MVSAKLGLSNDVGSDERALMETWANEGVIEVLLRTHCFIEIGDMSLTAGVSEYRLDDDILAIVGDRVTSTSRTGTFEVVTLEEMIARQSINSAIDRTGTTVVAMEGNLLIAYPTPSTGESIRYFYVPRPTPMTDDNHDPSSAAYGGVPSEYHLAIQTYMLWQGAEYDNKGQPMEAKDYASLFENLCKQYRKYHRQKAQRGLRPARVGYPGRNLGRRNDVYPAN
jgi:hypothetical protein